ncbi:ribonuclease Z [Thalassobacillus pellis]|uniref:ribonuclease Z n=1 Tax=Thalassobacillus pellis TaxID=748008 RepID=UPI001960EC2D|nr:ribonuclease Z [Thalassobacillus pellis]MBM7552376.1 ribonuclease Z [Thalassobacillus pellis]
MELLFLGTGSGVPSKERNVAALALQMLEERQSTWLFDCGESTQHQILKTNIRPRRIEKIFISHLHGDHIYGLPGLLSSRSFQAGETPCTVYGPKGLREYIETALRVSGTRLTYSLAVKEISEGIIYEDDSIHVTAVPIEHGLESFGYIIEEKEQQGKLLADKLRADGINPGPVYQKIKENETTQLDDGTIIYRKDYIGQPKSGRKIAIMGDTRYKESLRHFINGADILVHEATFAGNDEHLAHDYYHSTTRQAATLAKLSNVKQLILTHISSRYQGAESNILLDEAREIFPDTVIARDFYSHPVPANK